MKYIVPGDPTTMIYIKGYHKAAENSEIIKRRIRVTLTNQHDDQPLFSGALSMDIKVFYPLLPDFSYNKKHSLRLKPYIINTPISEVIRFYETLAKGILFKNEYVISCANVTKLWDDEGRAEFTITEIR